jgi:hypothetical protein
LCQPVRGRVLVGRSIASRRSLAVAACRGRREHGGLGEHVLGTGHGDVREATETCRGQGGGSGSIHPPIHQRSVAAVRAGWLPLLHPIVA